MTGEYKISAPPLVPERSAAVYSSIAKGAALYAVLTILAVLPYLPLIVQPFLSDDYVQLDLGRRYGPLAAWPDLWNDALYRCRATSIVLTHWTEEWFGTAPLPFYISSILLHVLNTWMLMIVGRAMGFGAVRTAIASAFFAVYLGHQEAVMWYAAVPELLLFFFCGCFLLSWNRYVRHGSEFQYALAMVWFALALLSKEAGVVLVPIAAALAWQRDRRRVWSVAPLGVAALAYAAAIFGAKDEHLHLNDGTFSLHAPFLITWTRSLGRLFWLSGLLGVLAILFWRRRAWRSLTPAAIWTGVALLPFSFLTYMTVVPSRHTYLASAGIGFFVATGMLIASARSRRRWVLPALLAIMLTHNSAYILIKKRRQFLERAEATEELLRLARRTGGPIYVTCFPYGREVAKTALEIVLSQPSSRLVWSPSPPPGVTTFCAKNP